MSQPANLSPSAAPSVVPLTKPSVGAAELAAVAAVFDSGWLAGQGPRSAELEDAFRDLTSVAHTIAVNNCTAGLHLALLGLGIGAGDEVIVGDYSFPATAHAVCFTGARPVFVDVRSDTATIDPRLVDAAISPATRAIIGIDALGVPADWDELSDIARTNGLALVEDAACAAGGTYRGRACGSFGDVAAFSLHARKGITCGEGGVIATDSAELAERIRPLVCFGMESAYARQGSAGSSLPRFTELGYNYKLADILAAIATVQVGRLGTLLAHRRRAAAYYAAALADIDGVRAPQVPDDREPTWQTYAVEILEADRDAVIASLRELGVQSTIGTYAQHTQPVYGATASCPNSERFAERHLALPMSAEIGEADQDRVVAALRRALG